MLNSHNCEFCPLDDMEGKKAPWNRSSSLLKAVEFLLWTSFWKPVILLRIIAFQLYEKGIAHPCKNCSFSFLKSLQSGARQLFLLRNCRAALCPSDVCTVSGVTGLGACSERPRITCPLQCSDRPQVPRSSSQQTLLLSKNTLVLLACFLELFCGASCSGWCQDRAAAHRDVLVSHWGGSWESALPAKHLGGKWSHSRLIPVNSSVMQVTSS